MMDDKHCAVCGVELTIVETLEPSGVTKVEYFHPTDTGLDKVNTTYRIPREIKPWLRR